MLQTIDLKRALFEDISEVEDCIQNALLQIRNAKLRAASAHILNAGGKRIRPAVMLTAYKAVGGLDLQSAYSVAAAMELVHNWTLIHDDIIDESDIRRSVTTVHKEWDRDVAILAGDMLNNLAVNLVSNSGFAPEVVSRLTHIISQASMDVMDGEMLDVEMEQAANITEKTYFEMISLKTGALFSASAKMGAVMGDATAAQIKALHNYGEWIGLAFQVQDDLLDLFADGDVFGKEIGKDIKEGKRTLMVIHALQNADLSEHDRLREILDGGNADESQIEEAIGIMNNAGSITHAHAILDNAVTNALEQLEVLPDSVHKAALAELAYFIKDRVN